MSIEEAIKILDYKINMYKEDVFIGDLDKTNIEAIKKVLEEIERLKEEINEAIEYINGNEDYFYNYPLVNREHLLKILKGEDNE